ncbi:MAG: UDP-3-O-(3-hydroxymyristoyl)glucosamine N-acyltransferase [Woeseia sp.]
MPVSLGELATRYGCELKGDPATAIERVATLGSAGAGCISFFANPSYRDALRQTAAAAVILKSADAADCPVAVLLSDEPYLTYARIAATLHPPAPLAPGIHSTAVVATTAHIGNGAEVAANAVIGENCTVGDGVYIGPGCVLGDGVNIAAESRLLANVTVLHGVRIGARCLVHPGTVIGSDGFGNAMSPEGWVKVPQTGSVIIGDDVEIGANSTIDRGAIDDTIIENGVRLDNLVQIAHNVRIGEHTAVASMSGISGSTTIGKRCMLAGQSGIVGHISICDDVVIGGATMVTKNITEPGFYAASFPAEKDRDWKRQVARFRRLEELVKRVGKLEKDRQD